MPSVLVPLAEGFEEIEAITIIDVLRRGDVTVTTAGLESIVVSGSHQITVMADQILEQVNVSQFDLVVLPGGPGTYKLKDDPRIAELLKQQAGSGKWVAAICAAPLVLSEAGLLQDKRVTSYPSVKDNLKVAEYLPIPVVVDGQIITGRGPGTAMAFALKLVEVLQSEAIASKLASDMIFSPVG